MTKTKFILAIVACYCASGFALLQKGDSVPNSCWPDANGNGICLADTFNVVRVLVYNAGYCGPCNDEMSALAPRVKEFAGKPVVFLSLSVADFNGGTPTPDFLKQWEEKYAISFPVLAAPQSDLLQYTDNPGIPMDILVDQQGKLSEMVEGYDDGAIDSLFAKINALLAGRRSPDFGIHFLSVSLLP